MPYAPGIQDISGQLLGKGMTQASNIKAQATSNLGKTIADTLVGGIQQYKQNEDFKQVSLAKFAANMQDPEYKSLVAKIIADDSNQMGVPSELKKSLINIQSGKFSTQDAAMVGTWGQDVSEKKRISQEQQYKQAQTALALAQAYGVIGKANALQPGQVMTQEEFLALPKEIDAKGVPMGDGTGRIRVTGFNSRAPVEPKIGTFSSGGATGFYNQATGNITNIVPDTPKLPEGFERVPSGVAAGPTVAAPASLGQFMPAPNMAPSQMNLMATQFGSGAQPVSAAPSPAAINAINAVQAAQGAAPAVARAPSGIPAAIAPATAAADQRMVIRPIAGSPADIEAKQKAQGEQKARETLGSNINVAQNTIRQLESKVNKFSVGTTGTLMTSLKLPDAKDVESLLQTLEGNIAFDSLRGLKDSGTSLGQIAIAELNMLKTSKGSINQSLSLPLFKEQLNRFKVQYDYAAKRLDLINSDFNKGLTEPSKETLQKRNDLIQQERDELKSFEKTPEERLTADGTIKITKRPK